MKNLLYLLMMGAFTFILYSNLQPQMFSRTITSFKSNIRIKPLLGNLYKFCFDCDGCKKKLKNPECNACQRMVNYFNIFSIPEKYEIDMKAVAEKAKQLQKEFHPDKNIHKSDKSKIVEYSAYINIAKSTLLDDLKRAIYLMQMKGITIEQQGKIQDNQFMIDIFELQQEIEQADAEESEQITRRIQAILIQLKSNLKIFFQSNDHQKCKQFIQKYKYLHKALQNSKIRIEKIAHNHTS